MINDQLRLNIIEMLAEYYPYPKKDILAIYNHLNSLDLLLIALNQAVEKTIPLSEVYGDIPFKLIIQETCAYYGVSELFVQSDRQFHNVVKIRHIIYYLGSKYSSESQMMMGVKVGRKDHATVKWGIDKIKNLETPPYVNKKMHSDIKLITERIFREHKKSFI